MFFARDELLLDVCDVGTGGDFGIKNLTLRGFAVGIAVKRYDCWEAGNQRKATTKHFIIVNYGKIYYYQNPLSGWLAAIIGFI